MREEFEKLLEIKERLHTVVFNEQFNDYHAAMINSSLSVCYVRGAWMAFQEQQKKIDKIQDSFDSFLSECELWGFDSDQADRQLEIIQELLK